MVISNCEITKQDSEILRECVLDKTSEAYKRTKQFHTGIDLTGSEIYSMYEGTVAQVGEDDMGQSVIIQTGSSFCIGYKHLSKVYVSPGKQLSAGYHIGSVNKYLHVELYNHIVNDWPVRIGYATWYKIDPIVMFQMILSTANKTQFADLNITEMSDYPSGDPNTVNEGEIKFILSNNEG